MCRADSKRRSSHSQPERSGGMLQSLSRRSGNFSSEPQTASGSCLELEIIVVNVLCPAIWINCFAFFWKSSTSNSSTIKSTNQLSCGWTQSATKACGVRPRTLCGLLNQDQNSWSCQRCGTTTVKINFKLLTCKSSFFSTPSNNWPTVKLFRK